MRRAVTWLLFGGLIALTGCNSLRNYFSPIPDYDQKTSMANLKIIGLAVALYYQQEAKFLPPEPGAPGLALAGRTIENPKTFLAPFDKEARPGKLWSEFTEANTSYVFVAGGENWNVSEVRSPWLLPVAFERPHLRIDERLAVLYLDGHVGMIAGEFENCAAVVAFLRKDRAEDAKFWDLLEKNAGILDNNAKKP